ncbi:MAG: hypothetical protein ACYDEY_15190 [Acidimicrobiales bacterium]
MKLEMNDCMVVELDALGDRCAPEALAGAETRDIGHVRAKPETYRIDLVRKFAGIITREVEQTRIVDDAEERLHVVEHRVELIGIHDHLGRVNLQIDLIEVRTAPSSEVTIDVVVLVVDRYLTGIGAELHALLGTPGSEGPLQVDAGGLVVIIALGSPGIGVEEPFRYSADFSSSVL